MNILHGILMDVTGSMCRVLDYLALQGATDEVAGGKKSNDNYAKWFL